MKHIRLKRFFYKKNALEVAPALLGAYLVRVYKKKKIVGKIVETESYMGPEDLAAHGREGKLTRRNWPEFLEGGHTYVYFIYGMYWQFNVVTGPKNKPEAVLIRAVEPVQGVSFMKKRRGIEKLTQLTNGPGKVCQAFVIDGKLNGIDLTKNKQIWIEKGETVLPSQIVRARRIGVDYAGVWAKKLWRFYIKNNPFVSKK